MLAGPIFTREALTSPRQVRHYLIRSGYVAALFILMYTASQATFGWNLARNVGDLARFGSLVFQLFSLVQLSLVMFFALLFAAGSVAQEKDRETLILLLMTDLRNREVVLGKLFASLLLVAVLILASIPAFILVHMLGGVMLEQIWWALGICAASALAAGSWGSLVAYWRDKTFQTLAIGVLGIIALIGVVETLVALGGPGSELARWAGLFNPYRALLDVLNPFESQAVGPAEVNALGPVLAMLGVALLCNAIAFNRLRIWNPNQAAFVTRKTEETATGERRAAAREIWSNPVIWREIRTRAYGRRAIIIKIAYLALAAAVFAYLAWPAGAQEASVLGMIAPGAIAFVLLGLLSLVLVNAQAVTALTNERDGRTLELLLMTDISAPEFIFGKLGGILYNTKEVLLVPIAIAGYFCWIGALTAENFIYACLGYLTLVCFAAMLGLHSGLSYENSRTAIVNSLGTIFFLFIGIFIFMMLLVEARSSFFLQFQSFIVFIVAGSVGLYASLSRKNPSNALKISAALLPFLTFYALTEFLLAGTLGVTIAIIAAYGFTTLAMLVPAVSAFDVALGRTTLDRG